MKGLTPGQKASSTKGKVVERAAGIKANERLTPPEERTLRKMARDWTVEHGKHPDRNPYLKANRNK